MSLGDHLDELRTRLALALLPPLPLFIVLFFVSDPLLAVLLRPVYDVLAARGVPAELQVLTPPEMVLVKLKLSVIAALVVSAPWILFQAWIFVAPGLYQHERRFVHLLIPGSALLTTCGVLLLYYVMLPLMMHVLVAFTAGFTVPTHGPRVDPAAAIVLEQVDEVPVRLAPPVSPAAGQAWLVAPRMTLQVAVATDEDPPGVRVVDVPAPAKGTISQAFRLSMVVSFVLILLLAIVIAFQLPLVLLLLGWLDIVRASDLRGMRRHALFVCAIASAILTPADVASMVLMLVPLYGLFELGIVLVSVLPAHRVAEGGWLRFGRRRGPIGGRPSPNPPVAPKPEGRRDDGLEDAEGRRSPSGTVARGGLEPDPGGLDPAGRDAAAGGDEAEADDDPEDPEPS